MERPAPWKKDGPEPGWWASYRSRLEWTMEDVKARLVGLRPDKEDGVGWWEGPEGYALVFWGKKCFHVSEFAKRTVTPQPRTEASPPVKVTISPKQGSLF